MFKIKAGLLVAMAVAIGTAGAASALTKAEKEKAWEQDFKLGEIERAQKDNKYGALCQDSLTSRGQGNVGLGITQIWAKLRTRKHWEDAATKLYGAEFAKWSKSKGQSVSCEKKDKLLLCKASAFPCK